MLAMPARMKIALAVLIVLHAALHLFGFAKGFNLAALPQLQLTISRAAGGAWLAASMTLAAGAAGLQFDFRYWGVITLAGALLSQVLIVGQFKDAKYGSLANLIILVPALVSSLDLRPSSLRSRYERGVAELLAATATPADSPVITAHDLAHLPKPVQRYLERVGVVGKPRVNNLRMHATANMRRSPTEAWMKSSLEQYSSLTDLGRLFFLVAQKGPASFDVFHHFTSGEAHMEVKVLGLFPVADASGSELTQSETVTVLNDMCLLAPASLIDARLTWQPIDDNRCRVTLDHAGHRVSALLEFNMSGELVDFISHDRLQSDGVTTKRFPWRTPVSGYRDFGGYHLPANGEAQWEEPSGLWTYARLTFERIEYNVRP